MEHKRAGDGKRVHELFAHGTPRTPESSVSIKQLCTMVDLPATASGAQLMNCPEGSSGTRAPSNVVNAGGFYDQSFLNSIIGYDKVEKQPTLSIDTGRRQDTMGVRHHWQRPFMHTSEEQT